MMQAALLWWLFSHFFILSFYSIGSFLVTLPEMYRWIVEGAQLLTPEQFNTAVALGQAAPGPNVLIVYVLGWFVAGPLGAFFTLLGTAIPFSTMAIVVGRTCCHYADSLGVQAYRMGMAPVAIGLLFTTGYTLLGPTPSPMTLLISIVSTLIVWKTKVHMMLLIACGALIGALGLV
jgi:chromate transporter